MAKKTHNGRLEPPTFNRAAADPDVLMQIVDQIRDGVCLQDIRGRIEWVNPACERMFGWRLEDVRGRFAQEFVMPPGKRVLGPENNNFRYNFNSSIFNQNIVREFQRRDGSRFWNQQSFAVLDLGPGEDEKKVVITCRDVSDQVETSARLTQIHANLEHAAHHDELTGLANRKKLDKFLNSPEVASAIAQGTIGVLQIDIDKFKEINDTLGHAAGDATLRHVASALRKNSGGNMLACRTGGDEFLLICLKSGSPEPLQQLGEKLIEAIKTPMDWKGQTVWIGASIGASVATSPNDTGEELILRADNALYSAKGGGRGHVALYDDALGQKHRARMKRTQDLKSALAENQFEVYLQPQLRLSGNSVPGCEALIRWNHPEYGLLGPAEFLPEAERAGLAVDLDYMSMNLALDALIELRAGGFPDFCMSINVSSSILGDVNYPGLLDWALQSRNIDPASICVEILETTILEGGDLEIATAIERLRHLGVQIALDDFGTGYAGLAHMSTFDVDAIKLDRSMISRLSHDPRNRMIVRSIIRLCVHLGIDVVAEGVETNQQLAILRRANCPMIQGFGLARPMPTAEMLAWLAKHTPLSAPLNFDDPPTAKLADLPDQSA